MLLQKFPLRVDHYGRKLLQVADEQQLHTAEGERAVAEPPQHLVNGIEHVGAHHTHLVDYQQVKTADYAYLLLAECHGAAVGAVALHAGNERPEVKLEE